jgi:hypothetical protein
LFLLLFMDWHGMCNRESMGNINSADLDGRKTLRKDRKVNKRIRLAISTSFLALGLGLVTAPAFAGDSDEPAAETVTTPDQHSRETAKAANEAAVSEAVNAVMDANRLDLDIRLIGRTSVTVASGD